MPEIEDLFRAVEDNPEDIASYGVLADALEQAGDPRAELIQVHHRAEAATGAERERLRATAQQLIAKRRDHLLARLANRDPVDLTFEHGVLSDVTVSAPFDPEEIGKVLAQVFRAPDARLLRTTTIAPADPGRMDMMASEPPEDADPQDDDDEPVSPVIDGPPAVKDAIKLLLAALTKWRAPAPPALRALVLGGAFEADPGFRCFSDPWSLESDDVSRALEVFPELTTLRVDLGCVALAWSPVVSDRLRHFTYMAPNARTDEIEALAGSRLPALESFTFGAGGQYIANYDYEVAEAGLDGIMDLEESVTSDDYDRLFEMLEACTELRELGLPNCATGIGDVLAALAEHRLIERLAVLDLSWSEFEPDDAAALVRLLARAPALRELRLEGTSMSPSIRKELEASSQVTISGSAPRDRRRYRYIVTME